MKAFVQRAAAGAPKIQLDVPIPALKPGHILVKNEYCGINFLDLYHRDGLYPLPDNTVLGTEAAGVVCDCGDDLKSEWMNKRVVFSHIGGFAQYTLVPISKTVQIPDDISSPTALALTIMGMTAHYLCTSVGNLKRGDNVLVHAAASGTGNMIAQIAANVFEANVVATCSSGKLAGAQKELPNVKFVDYTGFPSDLATTLRSYTPNNEGFRVVYDGVGKSTFLISLDSCRVRGLVAFFGNASGPVPPIDPLLLNARGSLSMIRPKMTDFVATPEELAWRSQDVFGWTRSKKLTVNLDKQYESLDTVNDAMNYIKNGQARGKVTVKI